MTMVTSMTMMDKETFITCNICISEFQSIIIIIIYYWFDRHPKLIFQLNFHVFLIRIRTHDTIDDAKPMTSQNEKFDTKKKKKINMNRWDGWRIVWQNENQRISLTIETHQLI